MGGGRQVPEPPAGSEDDPTLNFTTTTSSAPQNAGYGCYIAPHLKVGTVLNADKNNCDLGWYCPHTDATNTSTSPVFCPPSGGCAEYRLGSLPCSAQGLYEPIACKPGKYCPDIHTMLDCPANYFCPTGTVTPYPCGFMTLCPTGSVTQTAIGPLILMGIFDVILGSVLLYIQVKMGLFKKLKGGSRSVVSKFFRGANYALEERARNAASDGEEGGSKVPADTVTVADPQQLQKLVAAFHSALGHRELRMNFRFENLALTLKTGKKVLEGVTGEIKSKRMTAIIGPSGAGKTTFMNVLMGKVPRTGGKLFINGAEAEIHLYRKIIGYVPQEDVMLRELTVREVVMHSARVRLPGSWSSKQIEDHVDNVLKALNLSHVANSFIGDETTRGVSGGQRKRVNIGMELAAAPLAIFLDEPTSGLDATAALEVADILHHIAHLGLTIVSVIHQPRIEIFRKFDDVLMIAPGGKVAYLGPIPQAQRYFESLGFDFDPFANMSDVLMDILSGKAQNNRYAFGPQQLVAAWENRKVREFLLEYPLAGGSEEPESVMDETGSFNGSGVLIGFSAGNSSQAVLTQNIQRGSSNSNVGQWLVSVNGPDTANSVIGAAEPSEGDAKSSVEMDERNGVGALLNGRLPSSSSKKPTTNISDEVSGSSNDQDAIVVESKNRLRVINGPAKRDSNLRASVTTDQITDATTDQADATVDGNSLYGPKRNMSHVTLSASIVESLSKGTALAGTNSNSDEDTRLMEIEFHRLAPQVVKERGASFFRQFWYCHNRSLVQQSRATGALVLEIFVAMFAGLLMGLSTQGKVKELFNGVYRDEYVLLSPAPLDLLSLYGLLLGIGIALAGAPSGVKVFGEEKPVYWREAASGHSKPAYYLGKTVATIYRLILTSLHFTGMYVILAKPVIDVYMQYILIFLQFYGVYGMSCIISLLVKRENASLLSVVIGLFAAVFCGYGPNLVQARNWGILFIYELSFNKWTAEANYATTLVLYRNVYNLQVSADLWGYTLTQVNKDLIMAFVLGCAWRIVGYILLVLLHMDKQR